MYDAYVEYTTNIVVAYVSNNTVGVTGLAKLINEVGVTLKKLETGEVPSIFQAAWQSQVLPFSRAAIHSKPMVPIERSVTLDFLLSLEKGRNSMAVKRHLANAYGMTPDEYRAEWGLSSEYPMVAPHHAERRALLAKKTGLGKVGRQPTLPRERPKS